MPCCPADLWLSSCPQIPSRIEQHCMSTATLYIAGLRARETFECMAGVQMSPTFRRPPPGATDVLAKLAPWFPKGFAAGRAAFVSPAKPLDTAQLGTPILESSMKDGAPLVIYRSRLADANVYTRVRSDRCCSSTHQGSFVTDVGRL
jgi:hypothetical protein